MTDYARCNFDGLPLSPGDRMFMTNFLTWLRMDTDDQRDALRLDPEWRKFILGIPDA